MVIAPIDDLNTNELNFVRKIYPNWRPKNKYQLHAVYCKLRKKYDDKCRGQKSMRLPKPKKEEPKYEQMSLFNDIWDQELYGGIK